MGLLDNLSKSFLGLNGQKPNFSGESKDSTLHFQSSTIGDPIILRNSSILDETDTMNRNKFRSNTGKKYTDNLPK
jgi:hypothetical protein